MAEQHLAIAILTQTYQAETTKPLDIARAVARRISEYLPLIRNTEIHFSKPGKFFLTAKTSQKDFAGKRLRPLHGIPSTINKNVDSTVVEALIDAGAFLRGSYAKSVTLIATHGVSFALGDYSLTIDQATAPKA